MIWIRRFRNCCNSDLVLKAAADFPDKECASGMAAMPRMFPESIRNLRLQTLATMLQNSQRPVIVCGTDIAGLSVITAAADLALQLQAGNKRAGLFYVLPGANALWSGHCIRTACESFSELLGAIENGKIKALLLVEIDPLYHFPDPERVKNALGKLDLLVVMDYLPNRTIEFVEQTPATMGASAPIRPIIFPR